MKIPTRIALGGLVAAVVFATCSSVPKLPVVGGATMEISRSADAIHPGEHGYESMLQLHWLGTSCHYIQLGEIAVLTDPFVTNGMSLLRPKSDPNRVAATFSQLRQPPDAVVVNHAHVDHLLDAYAALSLPSWRSKRVRFYGSRSAENLLAGWRDAEVMARVETVEPTGNRWIEVPIPKNKARKGYRLRFKVYASVHSPHLKCGGRFLNGVVREPLTEPPSRTGQYQVGKVLNYLIELTSPAGTFRVFHGALPDLDNHPDGVPKAGTKIDVVFLAAPSAENVSGYPIRHLRRLNAPYVVLSHFNNFLDKNSDDVLSAFGQDLAKINDVLRGVQDSYAPDPMHYPRFKKAIVPAITSYSTGDRARNVVRISAER